MGEVVQMPIRRSQRAERQPVAGASAEILLYTGVWRERIVEPAPRRPQRRKGKPAASGKKRA